MCHPCHTIAHACFFDTPDYNIVQIRKIYQLIIVVGHLSFFREEAERSRCMPIQKDPDSNIPPLTPFSRTLVVFVEGRLLRILKVDLNLVGHLVVNIHTRSASKNSNDAKGQRNIGNQPEMVST
jgi:hypothetical protein